MTTQESLFVSESLDDNSIPYSLSELEVYNWGPFKEFHRVYFDPSGSALIGKTASGKTTLVDAIMTLIAAQPKYNLASTGGHESDRDLMSYVRGVTGEGGDDESIHTARPGKTITGISTTYSQGKSKVRLTALLWLDSVSSSQKDMKRLFIFDESNHQGLADYLMQLKELGIRGLKVQLKEKSGLVFSDSKKTYLAQCRRFFEVSDNAFTLLNRAAGLKQLNSIDNLFRDFVLDDQSAFSRASEVVSEFAELQGIHNELEIAKAQHKSLLPIDKTFTEHQKINQQLSHLLSQHEILPLWFAHHGQLIWKQYAENHSADIKQFSGDRDHSIKLKLQQKAKVDELYQTYQKLGGTNIEDLKRQIVDQDRQISTLKDNASQYQDFCHLVKFNPELSSQQLSQNQQLSQEKLSEISTQSKELELSYESKIHKTLSSEEITNDLEKEINDVLSAPDSNIPRKFREFQQLLAQELNIKIDEIPFIAQTVEIQESLWHGAIERAIGSHRLRLIISNKDMSDALHWVNHRDNHLHIRLLNSSDYQNESTSYDDGFCHKLKFKKGVHQNAVKNFLSGIDRHCVNTSAELKKITYGMTCEGLMSGNRGIFDKQDQRSLNQGWLTGFDNKARLTELKEQYSQAKEKSQQLRNELELLKKTRTELGHQKKLLEHISHLEFSDLDLEGAQKIQEQLNSRLKDLTNPESDTAKAEKYWLQAKKEDERLQEQINQFKVQISLSEEKIKRSQNNANNAGKRIDEPLTAEKLELISHHYQVPDKERIEDFAAIERDAISLLQTKINSTQKQLSERQTRLGKLMVTAQKEDTGALSEVGNELEDIPAYLERLHVLIKEDLPSKLERFLKYLNHSSDQGVTQLLSRMDYEVARIEERIEDLNQTMKLVDFQAGRYLQLSPKKIIHESLQKLQKAQRNLRSAELLDDQGESHYKSLIILINQLKDAVARKTTRPALALLDPRYRLSFFADIIERDTGVSIETLKGSQGGSGGEKEIISSYILTASLSYALRPSNRNKPLFATVILDEAFSKSSQAVAARIIAALTEFGLRPLFVTPNKEMRLLRSHTSSAILVHQRDRQSHAISMTWEEIDQHNAQRKSV